MSLFLLSTFVIAHSQQAGDGPVRFPAQYDLRTFGYVSPVKDQGSCGCCWAFATMAAIESNWLMQGYGMHDLSEDNLINCQGYDNLPCYGGNFYMSSSMFGRHAGPVAEALDPYGDTTAIKNCPSGPFGGLDNTAYIPDVRFLPNDINTIKQALQDHGAVATTMMFDMSYYNASNYTYLYGGTGGYPHCISVVGWNDTITTASANPGAWIIKDSYGTSWANAGYFYISYDDPVMFTEAAIFPVRYDILPANSTRVYYYDEFGWITNYGFSSTTAYGLAHFVIGEGSPSPTPQQIKRIGTYAVEANTNLEVEIYSNFDGTSLSGLRYQTSMNCEYPGFYSIPIGLGSDTMGTQVYVMLKYQCPATTVPMPVEAYEANYTSAIVLQNGRNWIRGSGGTWMPVGSNTSFAFNLCIKMFTETAPLAGIIMQDSAMIGEPVQITSNCFPPGACDSLQWYENGTYIGSLPDFLHAFTTPGDNVITLIAYMGSNSDSEEKSIYIKDPRIASMYPSEAMQGTDFTAYIQGIETLWSGSPDVSLKFSGNPAESITATNVVATSQQSLEADFDIPLNASIGDWDLFVNELVLNNAFYVDILWGVSETEFGSLQVYPCPSRGLLNISIGSEAGLDIISLAGKTEARHILNQGNNSIRLNELSPGIYFLHFYLDGKSVWRKVILQP